MSLLLKALQNAAKNREAAGGARVESGAEADARATETGELSLEPVQPSPRASARNEYTPEDRDRGERQAGQQQAQTILRAGARPERAPVRRPGVVDLIARRPLVAFSTAAGLFAICYGVYLYLQITNPGLFIAQPPPRPPVPPKVAAAPVPAQPVAPPPTALAPSAVPPTGSLGPSPTAPPPEVPAATAVAPTAPMPPEPAIPPAPARVVPVPPAPMPADRQPIERGSVAATTTPPAGPTVTAPAQPAPPVAAAARTPPRESIAIAPDVPSGAATPSVERAPASRQRPAVRSAAGSPVDGVALPTSTPQVVPVDANVLSGYQALEQGRLDEAERMYRLALASDARNVDAMLGLASTLAQQQKGAAASQLYARVLEQDPRNAHAQAGLLNVAGRADPAAAEGRLKQLIAREPSAFLYFTLGNLYSEQGQWAAAQNAYFQAHNLAPDNPDYAFNLAVGLEHLSQPKLALDYYRRAVGLARTRGNAQFELARVENRIRSLEATLAQQP